jgi:hypothetical protein
MSEGSENIPIVEEVKKEETDVPSSDTQNDISKKNVNQKPANPNQKGNSNQKGNPNQGAQKENQPKKQKVKILTLEQEEGKRKE